MLSQDIAIQEDEDVIFEGGALHKHLSALGYADFETTPVIKTQLMSQNKSQNMDNNIMNDIGKKIYRYSLSLRSWIAQDCCISKEQLCTILSAETLLDDHAAMINKYAQKYDGCIPRKKKLQNLFISSIMITSSTYLLFYKYENALNVITTLCALYFTTYKNYSDNQACKGLKQLVLLQNKFYNLCKKGLQILKHGYKIKINSGKMGHQFHDLMEERLIYLQPITENLIKCMEKVSQIYYYIISIITPKLPKQVFEQFIITTYKDNAFKISGEINYEALKKLYHTYILIQSELLYLLAVIYDINTWSLSRNKISKANLIHITNKLIEQLTKCNNTLSPYIDSYYNYKVKPILHYKGPVTSQWQDVYLHLNLTCNKIQLAYDYIISMINDIDKCTDNTTTIASDEMIEKMMQKMDETYKQIDTAKNFAEFCSLLITKTKHKNVKVDHIAHETCIENVKTNLPVVIDTEPEILDEVFEEYIKEEYLKPLYEEDEEILLQEYKLDKLLARNFMSELKEALIDKQRSMTERESKALQRMYKNVINSANDSERKNSKSLIPIPPPMSSLINDFVSIHNDGSIIHHYKSVPAESIGTSNVGRSREKTINLNNDVNISSSRQYTETISASTVEDSEEDSVILEPLSLGSVVQFGLSIPPPLNSMKEETFIGSGENSESDIEPEND